MYMFMRKKYASGQTQLPSKYYWIGYCAILIPLIIIWVGFWTCLNNYDIIFEVVGQQIRVDAYNSYLRLLFCQCISIVQYIFFYPQFQENEKKQSEPNSGEFNVDSNSKRSTPRNVQNLRYLIQKLLFAMGLGLIITGINLLVYFSIFFPS